MIPENIRTACRKAIRLGIPCACFRLPGDSEVSFLADNGQGKPRSGTVFEIGPWLAPYSSRIILRDILGPEEILSLPGDAAPAGCGNGFTPEPSLTETEYIRAVETVIGSCRRREGKTVYSRVISGTNPRLDIPEAASRLFSEFPDTFGFLYFTPATGCWLGATPEILLSADIDAGRFRTMALAGTRPSAPSSSPWDEKNIHENYFVVDFFEEQLSRLGVNFSVDAPESLTYGPVQHLCRRIHGSFAPGDSASAGRILDAINPTPALCGTPKADALRDLEESEPHRRGCYGGFVAVRCGGRFDAFVNLRSARVAADGSGQFNIYAGGGITAASDPAAEFRETSAKASRLLSVLSGA